MNEKTLRVLEYRKIKAMLIEYASSKLAKDMVEKLQPSIEFGEVEQALKETSEASGLIIQQGRVGIGPIFDLLPHFKNMRNRFLFDPFATFRSGGYTAYK